MLQSKVQRMFEMVNRMSNVHSATRAPPVAIRIRRINCISTVYPLEHHATSLAHSRPDRVNVPIFPALLLRNAVAHGSKTALLPTRAGLFLCRTGLFRGFIVLHRGKV